jgi:hypothetical protein
MTEDARCVIVGGNYVDNALGVGVGDTCSDLQANHGYPGPIDATAKIVQPSITGPGRYRPAAVLSVLQRDGLRQLAEGEIMHE